MPSADEKKGAFVRPGFIVPGKELLFSYVRSSGPGGQKVNKTATKVRLKWKPGSSTAAKEALTPGERQRMLRRCSGETGADGAVQFVSERFRSREDNRDACRRALARKILAWLRKPKKRIPTSPSKASKEKRIENKRKTSALKKSRQRPLNED